MAAPSGVRTARLPRIKQEQTRFPRLKSLLALALPVARPDLVKARQAHELGGNDLGGAKVQGDGVVIAALDSGCRKTHSAFSVSSADAASRVLPGRNFSRKGGVDDVTDATGHGTAVCGLAVANAIAPLVAPLAQILPLKVSPDDDSFDFTFMSDALQWLIDDPATRGVHVICVSMGDDDNWTTLAAVSNGGGGIRQQVAAKIAALRQRGIPTIAAAGNGYFANGATVGVGMCFPAIMPGCISVGAVFTSSPPGQIFTGYGGASFTSASSMQLTPFSQRLPKTAANPHFTRLFAPGAAIKSASSADDDARTEDLYGTSAAAPCVAGVVALMLEWHRRKHGALPTCDQLEDWLLRGADTIVDNAGNFDNVDNTGASFKYVNALGAMRAMIGVNV